LTIALTTPVPRWIPSRGNNQLPIKAPKISDYEVANDPETGPSHDLTCQPACNETDKQYDQQAFTRNVHFATPDFGSAQHYKLICWCAQI
jgi:hypothetical protein